MQTYEVTIKGVAPGLLMHRFGAEATTGVGEGSKPIVNVRSTPEEQARDGAYLNAEGELHQPAEHLYQCFCKAAGEFQVKGRGKKTYKDAVKGNLLISPEYIPHGTKNYEVDVRPVRIQRARVLRGRAHLPNWRLAFTLQVIDERAIPEATMAGIIQKAGETIGIGDYRPRFGRFIVEEFKNVSGEV